ncbi:kinase [Bacillus sp. P14.5]|uniref:kinase n=1 Tax=Bacillus sp. P14.5 TaxID=1983400 RepID=UPI000DEB6532|nr:kinase [Bacillus sp. P14.5]
MEDHLQQLIKAVKENKNAKRFILAIDGLSRSGKTTLTENLCQELEKENIPHTVFHIDDHIVEKKKRYNTGRDEWFEYYFLQWDLHSIRQNFFKKLHFSKTLNLHFYDGTLDSHTQQSIYLPEECVIIVEGVFLQRQEWRGFLDFTVFLDCPKEIRFQRESEQTQKNPDKFRNRYWKAEDFYLKAVSPKQKADLVLQL